MLNQLLETIIQILTGWLNKFDSHAQHVEDKLDSLDQTASDIETNTEPISDIADNTGAVITPIQNIKSNTDSIKQSSQTSANNTTAILNNVSTLSTNTGRAAAFAEDCANNTLDIKAKVTTIASDTTQLRADSANIAADVSSINQAIGYYVANTLVTEDVEGSIANFDTDLKDYLQNAVVTIPADVNGISGFNFIHCGANLWDEEWEVGGINTSTGGNWNTTDRIRSKNFIPVKAGVSLFIKAPTTSNINVYFYKIDKSFISDSYYYPEDNTPFTTPSETAFIKFSEQPAYGTTYNNDISINYPSTDTAYHAYIGNTQTITFTVPITDGAEVDLLTGIVKINTSPVTYDTITPIAIRTFKGVNNIYSDVGTSALTYRETLKHYLDKNNQ